MDMRRPLITPGPASGVNRSIGGILVDAGRLRVDAVDTVVQAQKKTGLRFGETALKLKLIQPQDVLYALSRQFDYTYLQPDDVSVSPEVVAAYRPTAPIVEQLRALRARLVLRWLGNSNASSGKIIAVTSVARGEGRSFIAANLAVVFSQLGERTLLIDTDLRNPVQHKLFKLGNRAGLSSFLVGHTTGEAMVRIPGLPNLSVLPAGHVPPNPQELLGRLTFSNQLSRAAELFDVIILDTPASSIGADAEIVAAHAGAAVLVARNNATRAAEIEALNVSLTEAGTEMLGAILNDF
ncbi:MAG TPA: chain length determinant protein tyrosine kinase EpsG [Rhodocyclaceae bacterium]|nr:chain length determinant protein tyrosine kinase EpsG [Rhodocyclaceae bacterium]